MAWAVRRLLRKLPATTTCPPCEALISRACTRIYNLRAAGYHAHDPHIPHHALPRHLEAMVSTSTDISVIDFVDCYLDSHVGAKTDALQRLGSLPVSEQHRLLARIASCSLHSLKCFHDMRAVCLAAASAPWSRSLDHAIVHTMRPLYGPGFTRVAQLSVAPTAPPHVHDLLVSAQHSERVHATAHASDFLRKFGSRRMVHGMYHCSDPSDLLAILYSAILPSMPTGMCQIDAQSGGPPDVTTGKWDIRTGLGLAGVSEDDSGHAADGAWMRLFSPRGTQQGEGIERLPANTVAFYSVGSPHQAMRGMKLGTRIIYNVASAICEAAPGVQTVCTMSPIPGFTQYLKAQADKGIVQLTPEEEGAVMAAAAALQDSVASVGAPAAASTSFKTLVAMLQKPGWFDCEPARESLKPVLIRLCRDYLTTPETGPKGDPKGPRCKVSQFHLGNGARMHRLCWAADTSHAGLLRSASLMVNYLYSSTGKPGLQHTIRDRAEAFAKNNCAPLAEPMIIVS